MTDDELKGMFHALQRENASMREENAVAHAETRRHFDFSTEAVKHEVRLVAEAVAQLEEKVDREVERLDHAIENGFADTQAMIKFSHAELDRRVGKLEQAFAALQARVERLEETTH